jgi:polyhydroxyalkanoate synthase subunit PhaE
VAINEQVDGSQSPMEQWMKSSCNFWNTMMDPDQKKRENSGNHDSSKQQTKTRLQESVESTLKAAQAFNAAMLEPESMATLVNGVNDFPEALFKIVQPAWNGLFHLQQQWAERAGRIGKSTTFSNWENLDKGTFRILTELYEREFRQFLNMPQIGLTRVYQEHANMAADRYALFQSSMAEFLSMLYLPLEKSLKIMQEKFTQMVDTGNVPENSKQYYEIWIKILETHYLNLFKSPEYTETLQRTIDSIGEFMIARKQILEDMIQMLPVPTQKEMDELYKELYLIKKKVKQLEKLIPDPVTTAI